MANNEMVAAASSSTTGTTAADEKKVFAYKVAMLGDSGVGKTALTYQFTTSDYICAYDLSLGKFLSRIFR